MKQNLKFTVFSENVILIYGEYIDSFNDIVFLPTLARKQYIALKT